MANHLRICIVGGRSFGKTALVKSVAQIPCFVARSNKGAAVRLQGMSFDNKEWSQTKWDDVKDWQFRFTIEEAGKSKEKILSFADYAGEYFEESYEDPSTETVDQGENRFGRGLWKLLCKLWPWGGHKSAKRQIDKLFYRPDGVIILLPRDFGKKDENGVDVYRRSIYESRLLDYLEKVRPGTPVQIVISKWDLNNELEPKGKSVAAVVSSPAFKSCYERVLNAYRSRNEKEYDAGVLSISTKDKDKDGKWLDLRNDAYNEAYNVRELFTRMSEAADNARTERLKNDWRTAKWWSRTFVMPWRSLDVRLKNSTDKVINQIFMWSWLFFGAFIAAVGIATCALITIVAGSTEYCRLKGIDAEIVKATNNLPTVTPKNLVDRDSRLEESKWIQPLFFTHSLNELKDKQEKLKYAYVLYLERDLNEKLNESRVVERSPWEVSPVDRMSRAKKRFDIITNQLARIPSRMSSEIIMSNREATAAFIKNLDQDRHFDQALFDLKIMKAEEGLRGRNKVLTDFPDTGNVRTNDFSRLRKEIKFLEAGLSEALSNTLASIERRYPAGDYSGRSACAAEKIMAISNALDKVFISGSPVYMHWEREMMNIAGEKVSDDFYGPFDKAYGELNKDDRKAIAQFKEKFPYDTYKGKREAIYAELAELERKLINGIMTTLENEEKNWADDSGKSMQWRIGRKNALINAYTNALVKLCQNDSEYEVLRQMVAGANEWVSVHKKYVTFDTDWKSVDGTPETNKVSAIVAFLKEHDKETYSEYTNRIDAAEDMARDLSAKFVQNCTNEIALLRQKSRGGYWKTRVETACVRIRMIESVLPSVLDSDKKVLNDEIQIENGLCKDLTRNGEFNDAFVSATNAPVDTVLFKIMDFRGTFMEDDYRDHADAYMALEVCETNALAKINKKFNDEIKNVPDVDVTNFLGRKERAVKIRKANEHAMECIPTNHQGYTTYSRGRDFAAEAVGKYANWVRLREEANRIMDDAKKCEDYLNEERLQAYKSIISKARGFYGKFAEKDYADPELHEIYANVRSVLGSAENVVMDRFSEEYEAYKNDSQGSDDDRIATIKDRITLIDEYLPVFLPDSDCHTELSRKRAELISKLDDSEKDKEFRSYLAKCNQIVDDEGRKAIDRMDAIDQFISKYQELANKPNVGKALESMKNKKSMLELRKTFEDLNSEKATLVDSRPKGEDEEDSESLLEYKRSCLALKAKFAELKKQNVESVAKTSVRELEEQIKWVNGKLGDGSWNDIKKKEKKYRERPNRQNYDTLIAAIKTFDRTKEGNSGYAKSVDDIEANVENDRRLVNNIKDAKTRFLGYPTQPNFISFMGAVRCFCVDGYRKNDDLFKTKCNNFYNQIYNNYGNVKPISLKWRLLEFDFKDTDYERKLDYSINVLFKYDSKDEHSVAEIGDISPKDMPWHFGDHHDGRDPEGYLSVQAIDTFVLEITIKHQWGAGRSPNKHKITGNEILASGIKNEGAANMTFSLKRASGYQDKPKQATITFRFSGLPTLPDEEF